MRKKNLLELQRISIADFKKQAKTPIILVLDNVRSGLNTGSAFRTADGFALEKIYLCGITATPPHKEILKTAIGATESVDWCYIEDPCEAVRTLQAEGWQVWAVEQAQGSQSLEAFDFPVEGKVALVFGNEVVGVSEGVMEIVDGTIEVPQYGAKHSFNIAVCIGIVTWELFRQWKFSTPKHAPQNTQ
jgi:tRNA G18 (ribose-2'-O)-methylase SpoU